LDGQTIKRLVVSRWSAFTARMQMRVTRDIDVTYYIEPGSVANLPPEINI